LIVTFLVTGSIVDFYFWAIGGPLGAVGGPLGAIADGGPLGADGGPLPIGFGLERGATY